MSKYNQGDKIEFNTNRPYTKQGQLIEAEILEVHKDPDGFDCFDFYRVKFHDKTRMIKGIILANDFTEREIMYHYDKNNYTSC